MKRILASLLLSGTILASSGIAWAAKDLPVTRVVLSTSGLANFEHAAKVSGSETLSMKVRMDQVDDLLKSLVVFDPKGRIGGVALPGKEPLSQVFRDLPFTRHDLNSPVALLNAYQGAEVSVNAGGPLTGKLLQVVPEMVDLPDGKGTVTRHRVSLVTSDGMKQVMLEDLKSIAFTDEKIRKEIDRALSAVRENGTAESRDLSVSLKGEGERGVTLAYVVEAPLWKAAYRLVMPEKDGEKGLMQGWGVIENMTGGDWKDVDVTLISGNPVTYRQALYQSYRVDRPSIPVEVFGRVMPRMDSGVIARGDEMDESQREEKEMRRKGKAELYAPMKQSMMAMDTAVANEGFAGGVAAASPPMPMEEAVVSSVDSMSYAANAAQSAEATTQVLFRFPDKFSLKAGETMMLPFASRSFTMEKLALYQPDTNAQHPLAAVRITNDGESSLPPGILTIYEENKALGGTSFVGDAKFPILNKGEDRLIGYALDSKTAVDREDKSLQTEGTTTIVRGIMKTAIKYRMETAYTIKAPAEEDRTVMIEHPRQGGYELIQPDSKATEVTATHYRIKVPVKAGQVGKTQVVLEQNTWQHYQINGLSTADFQAYASARGNLTPQQRKVFEKLAKLRSAVDVIDQQMANLENNRQMIFNDQQRLRENIERLDGKSDLKSRYMEKMNEQETQLEKIEEQRQKLDQERVDRWRNLEEFILSIEM